jgi:hypothetical protein
MIVERILPSLAANDIQSKTTVEQDDNVFLIKKANTDLTKTYQSLDLDRDYTRYLVTIVKKNIEQSNTGLDSIKRFRWFWRTLFAMVATAENSRIIISPADAKKRFQNSLNRRVGKVRAHESVFGFVKGKSAFDCANAHTEYHSGPFGLLIKMDISNFFNSFSDKMISKALSHHGFLEEETKEIIDNCTMDVSFDSQNVENILGEVMRRLIKPDMVASIKRSENIDIISSLVDIILRHAKEAKESDVSEGAINKSLYKNIGTGKGQSFRNLEETDNLVIKRIVERVIKCGPNTGMGTKMLYQGGPSSPFLSNVGFKVLDYRINAYAKKCDAFYTRYADDLCFSFKERRTTKQINLFTYGISKMLNDGGFKVHPKKTTISGLGSPQMIVGYCVNSGQPTIPKRYKKMVYREIQEAAKSMPFYRGIKEAKIQGMLAYIDTASKGSSDKLRVKLKQALQQQTQREIEI